MRSEFTGLYEVMVVTMVIEVSDGIPQSSNDSIHSFETVREVFMMGIQNLKLSLMTDGKMSRI